MVLIKVLISIDGCAIHWLESRKSTDRQLTSYSWYIGYHHTMRL